MEEPQLSWKEFKIKNKNSFFFLFKTIEWILEWLSIYLKRWAFLDILDRLGRLSILVAIITWFIQLPVQKEKEHQNIISNAWTVLNTAQGKFGSGGREKAINDLIKEGVSLYGVNLSNGYYKLLKLSGQNMERSNFENSYILDPKIIDCGFIDANFDNAEIVDAFIMACSFQRASFVNAIFNGDCCLDNSSFEEAYCKGIEINSSLSGTDFTATDLRGSNLSNISSWKEIKSIRFANIYGIINAPKGFLEWALQNGAVQIKNTSDWINYLDTNRYYTYWLKRHFKNELNENYVK